MLGLNKSVYMNGRTPRPAARKLAATNDPLERLRDYPFEKLKAYREKRVVLILKRR